MASINERHKEIKRRLEELDQEYHAARKPIEGELIGLRHECTHPAMRHWSDG